MNVVVTCEFFDLQDKKPRHIGEVLTLSDKRYKQLSSKGLVELVLDTKSSNKSKAGNKKGSKQNDDNRNDDSTEDNRNDDSTEDNQNDDSTEDNQNDDLKDADKENKDNK